jgi:hypothetical protein
VTQQLRSTCNAQKRQSQQIRRVCSPALESAPTTSIAISTQNGFMHGAAVRSTDRRIRSNCVLTGAAVHVRQLSNRFGISLSSDA